MIGTGFMFNGKHSDEYGISLVNIEGGMAKSPIFGTRSLITDRNPRKEYNYFYGVKKEPIKFTLTFAPLINTWDTIIDSKTLRQKVFEWLVKDNYCEFYTDDGSNGAISNINRTDRRYYIICTGEGNLMTDGNESGYITMDFENLYPYALTSVNETSYTVLNTPKSIVINNISNVAEYYYPIIEFTLTGSNTSVSIVNTSVSNETFTIAGLTALETVYINNETKQITSRLNG